MVQKYAYTDTSGLVIGFYSDDIHGDKIPSGSIAISDDQHQELLSGQTTGKRMHVSACGTHSLLDPPPPNAEQIEASLRSRRNTALTATDGAVSRHRDQVEIGSKTTLSGDQYKALQAYRKALRDLPAKKGFPRVELPTTPDFVGEK